MKRHEEFGFEIFEGMVKGKGARRKPSRQVYVYINEILTKTTRVVKIAGNRGLFRLIVNGAI